MCLSMRSTVALCGVSLLSCAPSLFGQSSTWMNWATGNWNVAANWSNGIPGLGGPDQAILPESMGTYNVTLNVSPTLASLFIGSGAYLEQPNNIDVTIGNVERYGTWVLHSTGASTDILLNGDAVISGGGSISLGDANNNRILGSGGTRKLTLAGGSIIGSGQLGVNSLVLVNEALIGAGEPTGLVVDLAPTPMSVNHGWLDAFQGSTLTIQGSEIDNVGGVIRARPQGTVLFRTSTIHGGTIEVQPGGSAVGTYEATTFDGITLIGTFTQPNNADSYVMGTILNEGIWSLEATGAGTEMRLASDVVTFDGPGKLFLSNATTNKIISSVVGRTLVNGPLHTISGAGQIGANGLVLDNRGLIEATQTAGLTIDCTATPASVNSGTILAGAASPLLIVGTSLDNSGGVLRAESQGILTLQTSTIVGGTIETDSGGEIHGSVYPPTLVDVTVNGTVRQVDGADVHLAGTIVHDGTWSLEGGSTMCELFVTGDVVTLDGSGQLVLAGTDLNNRVHSSGGSHTLVNGPDHVIRGGGDLCWGDTILANEGTIIADDTLVIDTLDAPASSNAGTISAENAGMLILNRSTIDNAGSIVAGEFSLVSLRGTTIAGGLLSGGTEGLDDGLVLIEDINGASRFDSMTFDAEGSVANGAELRVRSHLTNDGRLLLFSTGSDTNLLLEAGPDGTVVIDGDGVIEMTDNLGNRIASASGVTTLVHGEGHVIQGAGRLGNASVAIDNHGSIISTRAQALKINTPGATVGMANHGLLFAASTGELRVEGGAFTNDGTVESGPGCSLVRIGPMLQTGGVTRVDGGLTVTATYTQTGGLLNGDGTLYGNAWIEGGSTSPTAADGGPIGSLSIVGNYGQAYDGGLVVDVGLSGNDVLAMSGTATLGGALQIRVQDPFVPTPGQVFTILTAASVSGTFACIEYPLGGAFFHVVYGPQSVKLVVDAVPVREADLDFDGMVGATDIAILLGEWGDEPCNNAICCPADLNGDGKVNAPDLALLLGDWG